MRLTIKVHTDLLKKLLKINGIRVLDQEESPLSRMDMDVYNIEGTETYVVDHVGSHWQVEHNCT